MANPLAKTIMNNISKKSLDKDIKQGYCKSSEEKEVCNINKKEEELLKSILNKNNTKINLTSLKSIESQKSKNPTIKAQSLKSLSNKSPNDISKQIPKENKKKKITSLKDLAK